MLSEALSMQFYFKAQSQHCHSMLYLAVELARIRSIFGDAPFLDRGTCAPFQRWQSAFVSSATWGSFYTSPNAPNNRTLNGNIEIPLAKHPSRGHIA